jgi:proteic killer suppression protein
LSEILSNRFANRDTESAFEGQRVRWLPPDIRERAKQRLWRLVNTGSLYELRFPTSYRLEALRGDREGQFSIRINDQWRVCFVWTENGATEIEIADYH